MATSNRMSPIGSELEPEEKEKENCIKFYLDAFSDYIASNLDHKDLLCYEYFTRDSKKRYRQQGKNDNKGAVLDMIGAILDMKDKPDTFTKLVTGEFSDTENPKIMSILTGKKLPLNPEENKKHYQQMSRKKVLDNLDVKALTIHLVRRGVITTSEQQAIRNTAHQVTDFDAAFDLVQNIGNRDENWFVKFMMCLIDSDQKEMASTIDKDLCEKIITSRNKKKDSHQTEELSLTIEDEIAIELGYQYTSLVPMSGFSGSGLSDSVSGRPRYYETSNCPKEYNLDETGRKVVAESEETKPKMVDDNNFGTMEADLKYEFHTPSLSKNNLSPYKPEDGADSIQAESVKRTLDLSDNSGESLRFDSLLNDSENMRVNEASLTDRKNWMSHKDRSVVPGSLPSYSSSGDSSLSSFDAFLSEISSSGSSSYDSDTYLNKRDKSWRNTDGNGFVDDKTKLKSEFPSIQEITTTSAATRPVNDKVTHRQESKSELLDLQLTTTVATTRPANDNVTRQDMGYNIPVPLELRQNSLDGHPKEMKDKDMNVPFEDPRPDGFNIGLNDDEVEDNEPEVPDVDVSLRKYQEELARPALEKRNVIIVAPTGSGKTRVAMRIIQEHIRQQKGRGIAKVIFLVNQVALANQQGEACRELLKKYSSEIITGEHQRKMKCLKDFVNKRDILVVTAQVLLDAIVKKEISGISCFSLIVFDECHHTYANHTFNAIMGRYMDLKLEKEGADLPQIVGLTASVGVGKSRTIEKAVNHIKHLMANLDAQEICTVNDNITELREHVSLPEEETHKVPRREDDKFGDAVRRLMDTIEKRMTQSSLVREIQEAPKLEAVLKPPAQKGNAQYTQWVNKLWKETVKIRSPNCRRFLSPCRQHLDLYNNALIIYNDARMEDALDYLDHEIKILKDDAVPDDNESILFGAFTKLRRHKFKVSPNPKLDKLKEMVCKAFQGPNREDSRGIVFVKTRDLAKAIVNWMKEEPGLRELKPIQFVGQNIKSDKGGMTKVEQDDALKYFRDGRHKLIVATSVAEEGLDISKCNLVIRYDHVTNEIAMVQSRGRGRAADSKYMVIAEEATGMAEKEELNMIREVMMRKAIIQLQQEIRNDPGNFKKEIHKYQDEANLDRELKVLGKRRKILRTGEFELRCLKCDHFICWSEDVKTVEDAHHVVVDQNLEERVKLSKSGQSRYQNDSIQLVGKVICRNCGANLGTICIHRKVEFPVIKVKNFLIVDTNGRQDTCKQWKSAPFHASPLSTEDWREIVKNFQDREGIVD